MISTLRGQALHLDSEHVIVDVGGVGFSVAITPQVAREFHVGDEIVLHTHLVVREDALALFGFQTREELIVFSQLLSVSGVGPKSALGVLAALSVNQIAEAISAEDDAPFRRVSGIGPKTAKLIALQLAGKVLPVSGGEAAPAGTTPLTATAQVTAALVALGWSERVAVEGATAAAASGESSVPALLKHALAQLGPARTERPGA